MNGNLAKVLDDLEQCELNANEEYIVCNVRERRSGPTENQRIALRRIWLRRHPGRCPPWTVTTAGKKTTGGGRAAGDYLSPEKVREELRKIRENL